MASRQTRFERIVMPHLESVYRMARRLTHDPTDAEDMVQETFLKAYAAFENFQLRNYGAKPWLFKILHNVFYSRLGQQARCPTLMEDADFENLAAQPLARRTVTKYRKELDISSSYER